MLALVAGSLLACQTTPSPESSAPAPSPAVVGTPPTAAPVLEVTAVDFAFRAPDEIRPGWTTVRFINDGEEPHMVFMSRLPEGKTIEDYERELSAEFSRAWSARMEGRVDEEGAMAMIGEALPDWFPQLEFVGGPGLTAAGLTSSVTLDLAPGNYILECYVKSADGKIHYMEGMIRPLVVSGTRSPATPPSPDATVTLSNFEMTMEGELSAGKRTLAVHVAENPEGPFGHSLHVARLNPNVSSQEVVHWMNWLALDGMRDPAPARFVGGTHQMPTGKTAYVTMDLEPGRYLFVSEATGAQGVRREVTVR